MRPSLFITIITAVAMSSCATLSDGASVATHNEADKMTKHRQSHLNSITSKNDFETTLATLQKAIDARGFKTFAVIDHAKGAASIDEKLRPTTLIIFGNPKGGTPLMQAEQRLGLELPLKMLVAEDENGAVQVISPDIAHLFHEYGVSDLAGPREKISGALNAIATEAGGL